VHLQIDYVLGQSGTCELNSEFSSQANIYHDFSYTPNDFQSLFNFEGAPGADYSLFSNDDQCNSDLSYVNYDIFFSTVVSSYLYDQRFLQVDITKKIECDYEEFSQRWNKTVTVKPLISDEETLEILGVVGEPAYSSFEDNFPLIYDFKAPFELSLISGANQSAMADSALAEPVIVQVLDNQGEPVNDAKVWVEVSGGGTITAESLLTDAEGKVYVNWTLGNNAFDFQMLSITVRLSDDSNIQGSPLEVYAILSTACGGLTTVADADGNEYPVIAIGNQCWTQTNLRTTHFSDQTEIPNVTDGIAWINLNSPSWCHYDNNEANSTVYGKLYNWYVAADSRNVCPSGWHVPTHLDWQELISNLGGYTVAGGALKTVTGWLSPNTGATNSSGFSGLPAGNRSSYDNGAFFSQGFYSFFWSNLNYTESDGYVVPLLYASSMALNTTESKTRGGSIRCLKD